MNTLLSPGRRAQLTALGIPLHLVGATFARAGVVTDDPDRITIPEKPEELEDMLRDGPKMAALFKQKDGFRDFVAKYAKSVVDKDRSIADQVQAETQKVLAQWLKDNREDGVAPVNLNVNAPDAHHGLPHARTGRAAIYNSSAMGAKIDREFKGSADYFRAIWHHASPSSEAQARLARVRNAFSSTVPSEGGFLIPETLRADLLSVALETSIVRSRAMVVPMETLRVPFPAIDATSNASSVFGGIVCYWTEEGGALTDTSASFSRVILEAKKLTAYTAVPNELISDSASSFQAFIDQKLPEAISFYEDDAFINGNGVGMPQGFLTAPAAVSITKETSQPAATIVWENIVKMYSRMLPSSLSRAVWICSIDTFPQLATMALAVGTGGSAIWLNNGVQGPPMTILGRPVIFTEKTSVLGTAGDINFVDLGFYLIGDRQVMSALSSPHYKFQNDQTAFRIIERVDGQPWLTSAITPKNSGATLSPFVKIETRA